MIRKDIKMNEVQAPVYDPNREPVMDINRIRELLPHRYPFLLVDKIIEVGGNYIVGVKNITTNEPFFQGHSLRSRSCREFYRLRLWHKQVVC